MPDRGRDRGLATGLTIFFAMIVMAALLFILLDPAIDTIITQMTSQSQTTDGQNQIDQAKQIWNLVLFYFLFLAVLFIIARATFESRRPG